MSARGSYRRISDKERDILVRYYDHEGMTSKGTSCAKLIEEAAQETGLDEERVKVGASI